jgi:hypothetical protein
MGPLFINPHMVLNKNLKKKTHSFWFDGSRDMKIEWDTLMGVGLSLAVTSNCLKDESIQRSKTECIIVLFHRFPK